MCHESDLYQKGFQKEDWIEVYRKRALGFLALWHWWATFLGGEGHTDFGKEVMVRIQNMVTVYIETIQITFKLAYISPVDIYNCTIHETITVPFIILYTVKL